jgi:hypothetical protein
MMKESAERRLSSFDAIAIRKTLFDGGPMLHAVVPGRRAFTVDRIRPMLRQIAGTLLLLTGAASLAPVSHAAGPVETNPPSSISTLTFDLESRTVTGVLPFDEPFRIKATGISAGAVRGRVRFAPVRRGQSCGPDIIHDDVRAALGRMVAVEGFVNEKGNPREFIALAKDAFLTPNALQCFVFELDEKVPAEFRTAMRAKYEQLATEQEGLAAPDFDQIQEALLEELDKLARARRMRLTLPRDSVLIDGAASPEANAVFRRNFVAVINALSNKKSQMDAFCQDRAAAVDALSALQNGSFSRILEKMHEVRIAQPAIHALITENTPAFQDLRGTRLSTALLRDTDCSRSTPAEAAKAADLLFLSKSADLAGHEAELDLRVAQLTAMNAMLQKLLADAKLVAAIGENKDDVTRDAETLIRAAHRFRSAKKQLDEVKVILDQRDSVLDQIANRDDFL